MVRISPKPNKQQQAVGEINKTSAVAQHRLRNIQPSLFQILWQTDDGQTEQVTYRTFGSRRSQKCMCYLSGLQSKDGHYIFLNFRKFRFLEEEEENLRADTPDTSCSLEAADLTHAILCNVRAAEIRNIVLHDRCSLAWSGICWAFLGIILGISVLTLRGMS